MRLRLNSETQPHGVQEGKQALDLGVAPFGKHPVEAFTTQVGLCGYLAFVVHAQWP